MSSALYRKYRPQTFAQMIGQNHIKITLQHELESGEIGHAYLFCGPRGLGKTTSARLFAKSVNCLQRQAGESEPCNECRSCTEIMAGRSVDIIEIDAASNTGVENVRENIIENSRFNPINDKFKIFIIDEVHMLSASAFNALLKIMEEPPAHVIFILCTTEIHKLPVTIISRCQRFDFKKVTGEQLLKRLEIVVEGENKKVETAVLKRIILAADGCVRDAESLLSKVLSLGTEVNMDQAEIVLPRSDFEKISTFVSYLAEKNSTAAIESINQLVIEGFDLAIFTENLLEFLRQMMLVKVNNGLDIYGLELSEDITNSLTKLSEKLNWAEIIEMIEVFSEKMKEIKQASIPQFPLEIAVIRIINQVECSRPDSFVVSRVKIEEKTKAKPTETIRPTEIKPVEVKVDQVEIKEALSSEKTETVENSAEKEIIKELKDGFELTEVITKWPEVLKKLSENNFSLYSLLRMSQPLTVKDCCLEVGVANAFFKDRMEANNNRPIIEEAFAHELQSKFIIKARVAEKVTPIEVEIEFKEESGEKEEDKSTEKVSVITQASQTIKSGLNPVEEVMNMF
jgi:DNA polymerase III subunit gamma/tau